MYSVNVMDAPLGSILAEPVFVNNLLLINKGVALTNNLRHALSKFEVQSISIEGTFSEKIDETKLQFGSFDNLTYIAVRNLDFSKIMTCARAMVDSIHSGNKLTALLAQHDMNTAQHSLNVAALSLTVGMALNLSIKELENLATGALLHDIGKVKIPTSILNKKGQLTDAEIAVLKTHPLEGYKILDSAGDFISSVIKQIVYQHHEDFDGTGYPRELSDYHIYKLARIVHICDVFDALCSKRSYKEAFPKELVWEIMDGYGTSKFDPFIYKKFRKVTPYYMIGEELVIGNSVGIVVSVNENDPMNPNVYFNGTILEWNKLKEMNTDKINLLRGSEGILHLEKIL